MSASEKVVGKLGTVVHTCNPYNLRWEQGFSLGLPRETVSQRQSGSAGTAQWVACFLSTYKALVSTPAVIYAGCGNAH